MDKTSVAPAQVPTKKQKLLWLRPEFGDDFKFSIVANSQVVESDLFFPFLTLFVFFNLLEPCPLVLGKTKQ